MRASMLTLAALAMLMTAAPAAAQLPPPGLEVGQRFPAVALPTLDGDRRLSIDDFRGSKVLVAVFASW